MKRKRIIASIITGIVVVAAAGAGMLYTQGYFGKSANSWLKGQTYNLARGGSFLPPRLHK